MPRALPSLLAAAVALGACAPRAVVPEPERAQVTSQLSGQARWLRVAMYAAPFWGDRTKVLLSDAPLDELDLVETANGAPVPPPPPERILPPGTAVRIRSVEFPSSWIIAKRVVMSPRWHPWALLEVPGDSRPYVIVLSQTAASYDAVRGELERVLSTDDPSSFLAGLPPEQRDAIGRKELVEGMPPRAVEMAWGLPERRRIDRPAGTEEWSWPGGRRRAFFQDERVVRWER